jgi:hypothetical protein
MNRRGESPEKSEHIGISTFGSSEVLRTRDRGTPWRKSRNSEKITAIHSLGHRWRRSRKPSVFRLPGFQVDRGFVSPGVASREIAKRRRTVHLEETRGNNPGFREIFRKEKDTLPFRQIGISEIGRSRRQRFSTSGNRKSRNPKSRIQESRNTDTQNSEII